MLCLKRALIVALATALTVGALLFVRCLHVDEFGALAGERTYYLDRTASGALQTETLDGLTFLRVRGESVVLEAPATAKTVPSLLKTYRAQVQFTESVGGVTSYYCYAPTCGTCVLLGGVPVNLHIAISGAQCVVGSPIIFGGY